MRCNAPAAEVKSYGSGQTGADRKAPIEAQNERELHTGIQASCADIVALGYLAPHDASGPRSNTTKTGTYGS